MFVFSYCFKTFIKLYKLNKSFIVVKKLLYLNTGSKSLHCIAHKLSMISYKYIVDCLKDMVSYKMDTIFDLKNRACQEVESLS